ncbi:hypothetical protein [Tardiphaga sp.]|uniref:hypothetical protein n=1 Tax=Tardiphaga sp. TaxID=1926292 RepID=UPI00262200C0|nr:hypothetical protein [Tardiphaga sp.]
MMGLVIAFGGDRSGIPGGGFATYRTPAQKNQAPRERSLISDSSDLVQRPKNNHNRMITGIGTPISQSKSPRPIVVASMIEFSS